MRKPLALPALFAVVSSLVVEIHVAEGRASHGTTSQATSRRKKKNFNNMDEYAYLFGLRDFQQYDTTMSLDNNPTVAPSTRPIETNSPTKTKPLPEETSFPTVKPSLAPITTTEPTTTSPTNSPSNIPTDSPPGATSSPSASPTMAPSLSPTVRPSLAPTFPPTIASPTGTTKEPTPNTDSPTLSPTLEPTNIPSPQPTESPTVQPTIRPTLSPSIGPTFSPSLLPTSSPTASPIAQPTNTPSLQPTSTPSISPTTIAPTGVPTARPSNLPTVSPTASPTSLPTSRPTNSPTMSPETDEPTRPPSAQPTIAPSGSPTVSPTRRPTTLPTSAPSNNPAILDGTMTSSPTQATCAIGRLNQVISWVVDPIFSINTDQSFGNAVTPGDAFVFENNIVINDNVDTEGYLYGRCVVLEDVFLEGNAYCVFKINWPEGELVMEGVYRNGLTIVGGNGCYRGTRGRVDFSAPNVDDSVNDIIVTLDDIPPQDCPNFEEIFAEPWLETPGDIFIQLNPLEDGSGDVFIFDSNEINAGGLTGTVSGECTTLPEDNDSFCTISYEFAEGTILVQGVFFRVMSITAGTGCFAGISGLVQGDVIDGQTDDEFFLQYEFSVDGVGETTLTCNNQIFDFTWFESGEDEFIDYDRNNLISPGDMFVFDEHPVLVSVLGDQAIAAGRCVIIEEVQTNNNSFCTIVFAFPNGELVVEGFFEDMTIIGGSGCFEGSRGTVQVVTNNGFFEYTWEIEN